MFRLGSEGHVVPIYPPTSGVVAGYSDWISLAEYSHVDFVITTGAVTDASTIRLFEATSNAGSGAATLAANYYTTSTAASDIFAARTALGTAGVSTSTTNNLLKIISVDDTDLTDGSPYCALHLGTAATNEIAAVAILSGARWGGSPPKSAID